jgi:hypothetical protein
MLDGQLPNENRRRFQVDSGMFDAHHDHPPGAVPRDRQLQRHRLDQVIHDSANPVAIGLHIRHARPVVVLLVQIVPRHFVHAYREQCLISRVDPLVDESRKQELVDVESCRMAEVEDERMSQRIRSQVERLVILEYLEQGSSMS